MLYMCVVSMITCMKDAQKGKKHGSFSISFDASITAYSNYHYVKLTALKPKNPADLPIMYNTPTNSRC